jgi:AraC family transcriptional regulator, mar-sox-rob regulon activator
VAQSSPDRWLHKNEISINQAEDYIENNLHNKILLSDLAEYVYLSEYHFHRIFKQNTTESIHQFISRIKIERSAMLLVTNPKISITEIAYLYGYSESSAYCRAFKKHFLVTPNVYRIARYVKKNK